MARPTMRSVRDNIDASMIGKTGLANDQHFKRRILKREFEETGDPSIAITLNRQWKAQKRLEAAIRYGTKRRRKNSRDGRPKRRDFKSPEGFNECSSTSGRSYVSKAGARMEKKQQGFPEVMRHPATIGIAILPFEDRVDIHLKNARPKMRKAFSGLTFGAQVTGGFHVAVDTAADLSTIFPMDEWPPEMDPVSRPDEVFGYLHWHGIIADPHLSKASVRRKVVECFPGKRRVCVAKVQPERFNKNGEITHGAQGYLEYSMMEKTEINFKTIQQKKDAVIGLGKLSATWSRRNRSFQMGKSIAKTGIEIDPHRVQQLELEERLAHIRKNWGKLDFAQQFIHLWMLGKVSVFRKPQPWLKHAKTARDRFVAYFDLVKKWFADKKSESIDFYDYLDAPLE